MEFTSWLGCSTTRVIAGQDDMDVSELSVLPASASASASEGRPAKQGRPAECRVFIEYPEMVLELSKNVAGKTNIFFLFASRNAILRINGDRRPILLSMRAPTLLIQRSGPLRIGVEPLEGSMDSPLVKDIAYRRPCSLSKILAIFPMDFASREECKYIQPNASKQLEVPDKTGMFNTIYHFRVSNASMHPPKASVVISPCVFQHGKCLH